MQYREMGRTGLMVSSCCLGTMTWGEQNTEAQGHEQMDYALDQGVNFLDTAELYSIPPKAETAGSTERVIGTWLKARGTRDKVVLATKVSGPNADQTWFSDDGTPRRHNAKHIIEAVEKSLKRLQTDYIDLYQLHWPDRSAFRFGAPQHVADETPIEETLRALDDIVKAGKIRYVGLSNETPWGTMEFLRIAERENLPRMASIQNAYNLLTRQFEWGLDEIALRESIGLLAYSPLAQGCLTGKYRNGAVPPGSRRSVFQRMSRYEAEGCAEAVDAYWDLAQEHDLDITQMALKFCDIQPFMTSTIIGATTMDQLKTDIAAFQLELSQDVIDGIERINRTFRSPAA
jgi:aryl-alcohol dehydrogenase-like predicted oxidoreductase